jgi:phenylalanyl-tRNA synthetase beta chain
MKISFQWLKEFVDVPDDAQTLGRKLTNVGLAVDAIESKGSDTVYEFDITTNRPDCLNHLGVAREASALYGTTLRRPAFDLREEGEDIDNIFSIDIADPDLCGRYSARYIEGVKIGSSPEWLKKRLEGLGLRSINNVADVTNLVMMEIGQPLHAFDADTLHNQRIIVRAASLDEKITTLDGQERTLNPTNLVIADADRPVAIAGVMGGAETEISSRTQNVLLESAYFFPLGIRKTVRALGLSTEASYRYERGADIEITSYAADRAAALIRQVAGGRIARGVIDVYPAPYKPTSAVLRRNRIPTFLGAPVPDEAVERILTRLGFATTRTETGWTALSPSFRVDVGTEEDLLEEIARHYGFDQFPATMPPFAGFGSGLPFEREEQELRHLISTAGYSETYGLSFSSESVEQKFRPDVEPVRLLNPMSEDWTILRTSLVPSLLKALQWNLHHGTRDLQFFELGKVYRKGDENRTLVLVATGAAQQKTVHTAERDYDFFDIKGDVESILTAFDIDPVTSRDPLPYYYHPGRAARMGDYAIFGELHPDYSDFIKPRQRVYVAELDVEKILRARVTRQAVAPPRYPAIRRDLSLLVERNVTYSMIQDVVRNAGIAELACIEPSDRLEKGPFPESKYSISVSLTYQSGARTLTDDEVDGFDRKIVELLAKRVGAQLRN